MSPPNLPRSYAVLIVPVDAAKGALKKDPPPRRRMAACGRVATARHYFVRVVDFISLRSVTHCISTVYDRLKIQISCQERARLMRRWRILHQPDLFGIKIKPE